MGGANYVALCNILFKIRAESALSKLIAWYNR